MLTKGRKFIAASFVAATLSLPLPSMAGGIPVIDVAAIAEAVKTLIQLEKQFSELQEQTGLTEEQLRSMTGSRSMADLVNDPESRFYIPAEYQDVLKLTAGINGGDYDGLQNRIENLLEAATLLDIDDSPYEPDSVEGQAYVADQNQIALNSALAEAAYDEANRRTENLQILLDKVNDAEDPKDIADLNARIAAEQLMLTNEQNKLLALQQSQSAYWERQSQRRKEGSIKALGGQEYSNIDW